MEIKEAQAAIEAILFASGEPIGCDKIADAIGLEKTTVLKLLQKLAESLEGEEHGLELVKLDDSYQLCTKNRCAQYVRAVLDMRRNVPLSQAAMEILAIVAYNQPVTKGFIEQIRGVDSSGVIASLLTKGLIEEKGRLELPGRPLLYGTSETFLRCMNITSLDELPPLPQKEAEESAEDAFTEENQTE